MRIYELCHKEVVNICSCRTLGCPKDLEFDQKTGYLEAIIVSVPAKLSGFFSAPEEYVIPFSCVRQIGEDIILVEIQEEKYMKT